MENAQLYAIPFLKNLGVLYLTVFMIFFGSSIIKNKGLTGFSIKFWIHDNKDRFTSGGVFIFGLSLLMAVTDASPLFSWIGLDINASPVALGMGIAVILNLIPTKQRVTKKSGQAKEIQKKADEIIEKSADIIKNEEQGE
jgi:hypothetical protein